MVNRGGFIDIDLETIDLEVLVELMKVMLQLGH